MHSILGVKFDFILVLRSQFFEFLRETLYKHALEHLEAACPVREKVGFFFLPTVNVYLLLTSLKVCDWSGRIFGASPSPRSLTKKLDIFMCHCMRHWISWLPKFGVTTCCTSSCSLCVLPFSVIKVELETFIFLLILIPQLGQINRFPFDLHIINNINDRSFRSAIFLMYQV